MFGLKKETKEFEEVKEEEQIDKDTNTKFIFYGSNKKFQQKMEFYTILNSDQSKKILTIVECDTKIDFLPLKLAELFENYDEYKNLDGLRAVNLIKKDEKLNDVLISMKGTVSEHINSGDFIYCDLITNEYWVKCIIKLKTLFPLNELSMSLELKLSLETKISDVKLYLIKCGINFWLENMQNIGDSFTYFIYQIIFKSNTNKELVNHQTVKDLFSFKSEIKCEITLAPLEEHLMLQLQNVKVKYTSINKMRWLEFKELSFSILRRSKKFFPEFLYIQNFINKLLKLYINRVDDKWYLYKNEKGDNAINDDKYNNSSTFYNETTLTVSNENKRKIIVILPDEVKKEEEKEKNEDEINIDYSTSMKDNNILQEHSTKQSRKSSTNEKHNSFYSQRANIELQNNNNIKRNRKESIDIQFTSAKKKDEDTRSEGKNNFYAPLLPENEKEIPKKMKSNNNIKQLINNFRTTSNYYNLCHEFKGKIRYDAFINSVKSFFMPVLPRNSLEKITIPEFRNFTFLSKDVSLDKYIDDDDDEDILNDKISAVNCKIIVFLFGFLILLIFSIVLVFKS